MKRATVQRIDFLSYRVQAFAHKLSAKSFPTSCKIITTRLAVMVHQTPDSNSSLCLKKYLKKSRFERFFERTTVNIFILPQVSTS